MWEFSILLAATCALAAPARPLHFCHLQVLLFCILPRGGGSPLLPLLLTTDSSSHGNHQFSPGMSSSTYTAKRNATKQVSIRKQNQKSSRNCQPDQTNPKEDDVAEICFPLPHWRHPCCLHALTGLGYLPCQILEGTAPRTPAGG